jgi:hemolysin III
MKLAINSKFSKWEEVINSSTHILGAVLSIIALVLLIIRGIGKSDPYYLAAYLVYGISLVIMYMMSSIYHGLREGTAKNVFERFDHLSIYILIAGTYTPFCLTLLRGKLGWWIFGIQWFLAVTGIIFKSIWIKKYVMTATLIYVLMGWMIMFAVKPLIVVIDPMGFNFLLAGGLSYTLGVVFFIFSLFKFHHAVWHTAVVIGSVLHFFAIYLYL